MMLFTYAIPDAERVSMTTAMPNALEDNVKRRNNKMLAGFSAVDTSKAIKMACS